MHKLPIDCKFVSRADFKDGHPLGIYLRTPVKQREAKVNITKPALEETATIEPAETTVEATETQE